MLRVDQAEHKSLRRAAEKSFQKIAEKVPGRLISIKAGLIAMSGLLVVVEDQFGTLHRLHQAEDGGVRQGLAAGQMAENFPHGEGAMFPEQLENCELSLGYCDLLFTCHCEYNSYA
nr:hypothetical protein [Telmatocola sphagniphila]